VTLAADPAQIALPQTLGERILATVTRHRGDALRAPGRPPIGWPTCWRA
jgi:hypothetical protein